MKANPELNWSIQYWGAGDDEYYQTSMRGTIEAMFAHADEAECEFAFEAVRISCVVFGR